MHHPHILSQHAGGAVFDTLFVQRNVSASFREIRDGIERMKAEPEHGEPVTQDYLGGLLAGLVPAQEVLTQALEKAVYGVEDIHLEPIDLPDGPAELRLRIASGRMDVMHRLHALPLSDVRETMRDGVRASLMDNVFGAIATRVREEAMQKLDYALRIVK